MRSSVTTIDQSGFFKPESACRVAYYEARMAEHHSDWEKARAVYSSLCDISYLDQSLKARVLSQLGHAFWMLDEFEEAERRYKQALALQQDLADSIDVGNTFQNLAKLLQKLARFEEAHVYGEEGLAVFERNKDETGIIATLQLLVQGYWLECKFAEAEDLQSKIIERLKVGNLRADLADAYNKLADIYRFQGKLKEALSSYFQSLESYRSYAEKFYMGWVQAGIGEVYRMQGDYINAFKYINESLEIFNRYDYRVGIAWDTRSLGEIYRNENKHDLAMEFFENCLKMFESTHDLSGTGATLCSIAEVYLAQGNLFQAEVFFQKGISILKSVDAQYAMARGLRGLGVLYREKGQYNEAKVYIYRAMEIFQRMTNSYQTGLCEYYLGTVYADEGYSIMANKSMLMSMNVVVTQGDKHHEMMIQQSFERLKQN